MEKNYLRYVSAWHCGVITSPRCNVALDGESGEVICGSVRKVVGWAPGTGELSRTFADGDDGGGFASSPLDGVRGEVVAVACGEFGSRRPTGRASSASGGIERRPPSGP